MRKVWFVLPSIVTVIAFVGCSQDNGAGGAQGGANPSGGKSASGGATSGGATSGGASTGGVSAGGSNSGGASAGGSSSGASNSGGTSAGGSNSGGSNSGGSNAGGSSSGGSNGGNGSGGVGRGGSSNGGGGAANGGTTSGGMGSGGSGKGGAPASTPCSFPSAWAPGSPTYTTYTLPNALTACGYQGMGTNAVRNIVTPANFAAIPGMSSSNFNTSNRCGACVKINNAIITIVDECPYDGGQNKPCANNPSGHLDLSQQGASAAGVQGNPDLKNQAKWQFVPCPVNGNVIVRLKQGNNNEFFIENEILPIQSVTCEGQNGSRTSYGAWHFDQNVNGKPCTVTDISNRSIDITIGNTQNENVDTGVQFPKCQ